MEPAKIQFGFSRITKKTNIIPTVKPEEKNVELVECLEGQNIKVKDAIKEVKEPLIIPLKDNEKSLLDRIKASKKKSRNDAKEEVIEDSRPDCELTPDELATRQLIREAQQRLANGHTISSSKISILPATTDQPDLEGEKEPTLEDYESVPITDFGIALLRGMGWKEGMPIGKNVSKAAPLSVPELRPKGLGLGATKVVQDEMPSKKAKDNEGNDLILVKNAFAKIIAGHHKGFYCQVQGFDEEAGRVIIKVYPKGETVNINELMLIPVTKDEFSKGSKFINNAKYEEYKQISDKKLDTFKAKQERTEQKSKISETNVKKDYSSDLDNNSYRRQRSPKKYNDSTPERKKSSKSSRRSRSKSKEKSSSRKHRSPSNSSDDYYRKKNSQKHTKSKSRNRSSKSRSNRSKKDHSSDSDQKYEKSKRKTDVERSGSREYDRYTSRRK